VKGFVLANPFSKNPLNSGKSLYCNRLRDYFGFSRGFQAAPVVEKLDFTCLKMPR
jgi:hypothetical protein